VLALGRGRLLAGRVVQREHRDRGYRDADQQQYDAEDQLKPTTDGGGGSGVCHDGTE
jgi:hypothetical protein